MNSIDHLFQRKDKNILNIYFTAGYPQLHDTASIIQSLDDLGVDIIEIGMPYSDPLADGPTIQQSGSQAIRNGMTMDVLFQQLSEIKKPKGALIWMGYLNQIMQYGEDEFFSKCKDHHIDGLIIPDMPLEIYEKEYKDAIEQCGLKMTFLITPQTSAERIRKVDDLTNGFIYMVSDSSITGAKKGITDKQIAYFNRIKEMNLSSPRLIGFGISDHKSFRIACEYARGAIIGSAFIKAIGGSDNITHTIQSFVSSIISPKHDYSTT